MAITVVKNSGEGYEISLILNSSQPVLPITVTCLKEKFGSTSKSTTDLYLIVILGRNAVIGDYFQIIWQNRFLGH